MIDRYLIVKSGEPRPAAERIIFCDGAGGRLYRDRSDLELSHWRPNRTPPEYRAGTSTEICFKLLDSPQPGAWTVAVNNHLDVDGILSVYVLVHSAAAMARRPEIVAAAEMGDFWGWGPPPAQRLFQGLTLLMNARSESGATSQETYAEAFRRIPSLIDGADPECAVIEESLAPLRHAVELVESGQIERVPVSERFTRYVVPRAVANGAFDCALYVPGFNEAISPAALLWPQARAKWDAQRVSLVSVEALAGWYHDLWFPGYLWADTEGLWRVPGVDFGDGMESYDLSNDRLKAAVVRLQEAEQMPGTWALADGPSPFHSQLQSTFPVGLRFVGIDGIPTPSGLSPNDVGGVLNPALA